MCNIKIGHYFAVWTAEFAVIAIAKRNKCCSWNPVEKEESLAIWAGKFRGVMWTVSWQVDEQHTEAHDNNGDSN
jgi:hypothetical protein